MREREVWLLFQTRRGGERERQRCGCCFRLGGGEIRERGVVVVSD